MSRRPDRLSASARAFIPSASAMGSPRTPLNKGAWTKDAHVVEAHSQEVAQRVPTKASASAGRNVGEGECSTIRRSPGRLGGAPIEEGCSSQAAPGEPGGRAGISSRCRDSPPAPGFPGIGSCFGGSSRRRRAGAPPPCGCPGSDTGPVESLDAQRQPSSAG